MSRTMLFRREDATFHTPHAETSECGPNECAEKCPQCDEPAFTHMHVNGLVKLWSGGGGGGGNAQAPAFQTMPADSAARKRTPLATGVLDYFPAALAAVARISQYGNDKHNPGEALHWARGKSDDHADCALRHLADRGITDPETGESHTAEAAWRVLAILQLEEEAKGAPKARGAQ